jgi:hypothetical protein
MGFFKSLAQGWKVTRDGGSSKTERKRSPQHAKLELVGKSEGRAVNVHACAVIEHKVRSEFIWIVNIGALQIGVGVVNPRAPMTRDRIFRSTGPAQAAVAVQKTRVKARKFGFMDSLL